MKLDIQGQTVEVDDSFADLSPEEQQKTVGDIHQQLGTYAQAKQQQEAPADLSAVDKFRQNNPWADYPVGLLGTAGGIIAEHPVETAGALAVAKGLGIANSYDVKFNKLWNLFETVYMDTVKENKMLNEECAALREQLIAETQGYGAGKNFTSGAGTPNFKPVPIITGSK